MSLQKVETAIQLKDRTISGLLKAGSGVWSFNSEDPYFVGLFPSHSVCSFITESELAEPARKAIFDAVAAAVTDSAQRQGTALAA